MDATSNGFLVTRFSEIVLVVKEGASPGGARSSAFPPRIKEEIPMPSVTIGASPEITDAEHPDFCDPEVCTAGVESPRGVPQHRSKPWKMGLSGDMFIDRIEVRLVEPVSTPGDWFVEVDVFTDDPDEATDTLMFTRPDVFAMFRFFFIIIENAVKAKRPDRKTVAKAA
ncbi:MULTISPECIES: hypothetical protein [Catenuloplanes]|uniref:Uncharacterized protein n=1 Tax=Catenuloplanes niger TaxID=587534 RepID=A0AAE3ZT30_9ACTN|nr:hypothetical protein [Catenuloplanes niger]MDR7323648.1 hypothetical protein [Catenuloplanes niger]